jgi:hypothetical protein
MGRRRRLRAKHLRSLSGLPQGVRAEIRPSPAEAVPPELAGPALQGAPDIDRLVAGFTAIPAPADLGAAVPPEVDRLVAGFYTAREHAGSDGHALVPADIDRLVSGFRSAPATYGEAPPAEPPAIEPLPEPDAASASARALKRWRLRSEAAGGHGLIAIGMAVFAAAVVVAVLALLEKRDLLAAIIVWP